MAFPARSVSIRWLAIAAFAVPALPLPARADDAPSAIPEAPARKSEFLAYALMYGATEIPYLTGAYLVERESGTAPLIAQLLLLGGVTLGPTAGLLYIGSPGPSVWAAAGARLAGGMMIAVAVNGMRCLDDSTCAHPYTDGGMGLILGGAIVVSYGIIYSIVDTHLAAQRHNRSAAARRVWIEPVLSPSSDGRLAAGARAAARF
jgi:hypothetical protein